MTTRDGAPVKPDLGLDPPLRVGGAENEAPVRRAVHWRWLTGTILTGFTALFLMGGALVVALDNPNQFAVPPDASDDLATSFAPGIEFGQKGDRIRPLDQEVASRQVLQVSTVTKQGERDFIKLRPFAKVSASLVTRKDLAAQVPPFNAMKLFADDAPSDDADPAPADAAAPATPHGPDDQIYGANVDGEVSIKVTDFPLDAGGVDTAASLDTATVEQMVRAAGNFTPDAASVALADDDQSGFVEDSSGDPGAAAGVKIVPENVSSIIKGDPGTAHTAVTEKFVGVTKGESFRAILQASQVSDSDADHIVSALSDLVDLNKLHVGQKVRVAFTNDVKDPSAAKPIRVSIYDDGAHQATVARADDDSFVRADEPALMADTGSDDVPVPDDGGILPRVYDAVYETALAQQIPQPLIDTLIRVFAFDVDFQSHVSPGDQLEVFHSLADPQDPNAGDPEILYASLTLGGVTKRFYRYRAPDDGVIDYYDEDGRSAKKFLMRKPVGVGVITSGFGWRVHPILGYRRLHTGVDYGAPTGTPIIAAGNGVVERAGWTSGYGQFTLIKHNNGYETGYGHQSQIAPGIVPGARVHQGQIIGYVGSTGLSTGSHLHFEIRVNGTPVDPLRVRLPRGRVLEGDMLASFEKERARIDALLGAPPAPAKVASAAPPPTN